MKISISIDVPGLGATVGERERRHMLNEIGGVLHEIGSTIQNCGLRDLDIERTMLSVSVSTEPERAGRSAA